MNIKLNKKAVIYYLSWAMTPNCFKSLNVRILSLADGPCATESLSQQRFDTAELRLNHAQAM